MNIPFPWLLPAAALLLLLAGCAARRLLRIAAALAVAVLLFLLACTGSPGDGTGFGQAADRLLPELQERLPREETRMPAMSRGAGRLPSPGQCTAGPERGADAPLSALSRPLILQPSPAYSRVERREGHGPFLQGLCRHQ